MSREWKQGEAGRLRGEGKSFPWIGKVLGVGEATVHRWCSTSPNDEVEQITGFDGKIRPATMPTEDELADRREQAVEMRQSGATVREVAKNLGVSVGTAANMAKPPVIMVSDKRKQTKVMRQIGELQETNPGSLVSLGTGDASAVNLLRGKATREAKLFRREAGPLPEGKHQVIYADPPWQYQNTGFENSADKQYPTMPTSDICALDVPGLVLNNAVLFLWATNPLLADALEVIKAWGFEYKTNLAWVKNNFTRGFYAAGQHELLLVAVRGQCRPLDSGLRSSVFHFPKGQHSQKPDEVYAIIEAMYPGPYVELFARADRPGWAKWGNEREEVEAVKDGQEVKCLVCGQPEKLPLVVY